MGNRNDLQHRFQADGADATNLNANDISERR